MLDNMIEIPKSRTLTQTADEVEGYLESIHGVLDQLFSDICGQGYEQEKPNEPKNGLENSLSRICTSTAIAVGRLKTLKGTISGNS